jgi:hypothetical protein
MRGTSDETERRREKQQQQKEEAPLKWLSELLTHSPALHADPFDAIPPQREKIR